MLKILGFSGRGKKELLDQIKSLTKQNEVLKETVKQKDEQIFNLTMSEKDAKEKLKAILNKKKDTNQAAARAMIDGYYGEKLS